MTERPIGNTNTLALEWARRDIFGAQLTFNSLPTVATAAQQLEILALAEHYAAIIATGTRYGVPSIAERAPVPDSEPAPADGPSVDPAIDRVLVFTVDGRRFAAHGREQIVAAMLRSVEDTITRAAAGL